MQEEFMKETKIFDRSEREKEIELFRSIAKTRRELNQAHKNFEYAEEGLIDYYTYQIKANQAKLDYLTRLAKSKNMVFNLRVGRAV